MSIVRTVEFIHSDISDPVSVADALARIDPERVVHLSALLGRSYQVDPRRALEVSVDGTLTLLDLIKSHDIERVVTGSSISAYGDTADLDSLNRTSYRNRRTSTASQSTVLSDWETYQERDGTELAAWDPTGAG